MSINLLRHAKFITVKKGVEITIKSKETSGKLDIQLRTSYEISDYPLYKPHWLLFVSVDANTIPTG